MPELTTWVLIIYIKGSLSSMAGAALTHVEGFTESSCAEAAITAMAQLGPQSKAFCIPRVGRRL